ncbi:MAG TPA: hypothetical protein VIK11_09455 [Tepidiformaceae bacterium]|jgi:hypothetical protein
MTVFELARRGRADPNVAILGLLLRGALALFLHGLRHPFSGGMDVSPLRQGTGAMTADEVPIGRMGSTIVSVLAITLVLSVFGLVVLGLFGGDPDVRGTLTHVIETVLGVFLGIAAGRVSAND